MDKKPPFAAEVITTKTGDYIIMSRNDLISKVLIQYGEWEPDAMMLLKEFLRLDPGDVVDIGANMGAVAIPLAKAFPDSRIYAFEAQRLVYQQLCGNAVLNGATNIYPFHMAIGGPEDDGRMVDMPIPDYAVEQNVGGVSLDARVNEAGGRTYAAYEKVAMAAMDTLGLTDISLVKIDVEGYELKVLEGMQVMLAANNYPAVVFELWRDGQFPWVAQERAAITALLQSWGYKVDIIERVTMGVARHPNRQYRDSQQKEISL